MQVQQNLVPSLVYLRWRRPSIADLASQPEPRHLSSLAHAITIKRTEPMRQISLNTWNAARRIPLFVWRKRTRARELWQGNYHACRATVPWYGHFVPLWQQAKSTVDYDRWVLHGLEVSLRLLRFVRRGGWGGIRYLHASHSWGKAWKLESARPGLAVEGHGAAYEPIATRV